MVVPAALGVARKMMVPPELVEQEPQIKVLQGVERLQGAVAVVAVLAQRLLQQALIPEQRAEQALHPL
jgi:hypothetical protein